MGKVRRFVAKRERVQAEAAARLFEQINLFSEDTFPKQAREAVLNTLHRFTHDDRTETLWSGGFTMISRAQTGAIWKAIRALPAKDRPHQVYHAFNVLLLNLRQDTGEVMLTRDQLADELECSAVNVSHVMAVLERMGVICRERRKVAGVRGPGIVVYFVNPHVAWNGSLDVRRAEARKVEQPSLRVIEGGAPPTPDRTPPCPPA